MSHARLAKKKSAQKEGAKARTGKAPELLLSGKDLAAAWRSLASLGERIREPPYLDQAREIASLTMRRAAESLKRIVERLASSGYRFEQHSLALLAPPTDVAERVAELEALAGPLPLSLRAALEHIGSCNLCGEHPEWPKSANVTLRPARNQKQVWLTDPLVLVPIDLLLDEAKDMGEPGEAVELTISGDALTKAGYSGGTYRVGAPSPRADGLLLGESKGRTFVEHLRTSLRFGGFAGFAGIRDRPQSFIDAIASD